MFERKDYGTLEEAEIAKEREDNRSLGWCPMTSGFCQTDCVCFKKSTIISNVGVSTAYFILVTPGCGSPIIAGNIYVETN